MKKRTLIATWCIVLGIFLGACAPAAQPAQAVTSLVDGLGREYALQTPAEKIVTLSPPFTEILFAIGAGDQVIGRDTFSDYPEDALALTDIGGGYADYDLETILSLKPDLVIAGSVNTPELVQSLEDLGLKVYYLSNPIDLNGTFDAIQTLGLLSGHQEEAGELVISLEKRADAVITALDDVAEKPSVYYELDASDPAKPYTPGPGTYYSDLISKAGGENFGDSLDTEWAQVSLEQLLVSDPDIIILGNSMWGITPESVAERPGWKSLRAVQSGNVLPFDDNLIARFGPRQVDGLEALARILHPDQFK
jgi:iron complex transport system substrate-binding protein